MFLCLLQVLSFSLSMSLSLCLFLCCAFSLSFWLSLGFIYYRILFIINVCTDQKTIPCCSLGQRFVTTSREYKNFVKHYIYLYCLYLNCWAHYYMHFVFLYKSNFIVWLWLHHIYIYKIYISLSRSAFVFIHILLVLTQLVYSLRRGLLSRGGLLMDSWLQICRSVTHTHTHAHMRDKYLRSFFRETRFSITQTERGRAQHWLTATALGCSLNDL